ncbi:amidase [Gloeocapsopsis sp. IPPAS B-1203]|uniref:amidase n=1 Tax=Gloeocapsopsis sp. IPPAS B-1203 TaxID=2049454 RepID=UPI000C190406|nr:amidase [Gloeocapsopsis sp. IPPAS B-1203]PIG92533.1 amidase [Gloeocapsopsis sp. IPPAS B-1203]
MIDYPTAQTIVKLQHGNAVKVLEACLARIREREPVIGAWEYLNPNAFVQARHCDIVRSQGKVLGALHGVPVGIKDTFATVDMPTGWGTPIHQGRQFGYDAAVVERLKAAGAVIVGKTVTTEYAIARPNKTRNPHNPEHTPGASSSGSAAAVADGMVPIAIGTQMVGSILRPAAYCGVFGFKPSFGVISRYGLMPSSRELDHVGIFARTIADIDLVLSVLAGTDDRDPDCYGTLIAPPPQKHHPKLALILGSQWFQVEPEAKQVLLDSVTTLVAAGATVSQVAPSDFDAYLDYIEILCAVDVAANHGADYALYAQDMSLKLQQLIIRGRTIDAIAYAQARHAVVDYNITLAKILSEFDAILTPVTTGIAPYGLENTGSPVFCALWTLCGLPAISIPVGVSNGLPLGIQLVGKRLRDRGLLEIANWVVSSID